MLNYCVLVKLGWPIVYVIQVTRLSLSLRGNELSISLLLGAYYL
jgi:hypothetical protein